MKNDPGKSWEPLSGLSTLQVVITVTQGGILQGDRFYFRSDRANRITLGRGHDEDITLERSLAGRQDTGVIFRRADGFYLSAAGMERPLAAGSRFMVGRCELEFRLQRVPLILGHGREMPHEGGLGSFYNNAKLVLKRLGLMGG